jgi:KaiC/GvpD/RAD55 family RecA-like ATPase
MPISSSEDEDPPRCDYCRMPCPAGTVTASQGETEYVFCSQHCRETMEAADSVFTEYHGFIRTDPDISGMKRALPQGLPRNAFVLLSGQAGTRDGAVHAELVWRALQREEPAVFVSFQEPPSSVVQRFLTLGWNVIPYLESGQLAILDCFTYRVPDRDRMIERLNDWNQYLQTVAEPSTLTVRDPTDLDELTNKLDNALEDLSMTDTGMVLVDSLTELGTLVQPVQAYDFVKNVRADVCKGRFVPIFAGATYDRDMEQFPHDLDYIVDGVVDLQLNGELVRDTLLKRIRIRKMAGVLSISEWIAYEYTAGEGMVVFDPEQEIEKSRARREAADAEAAGEAAPSDHSDESTTPDASAPADDQQPSAEPGSESGGRERPTDGRDPPPDPKP